MSDTSLDLEYFYKKRMENQSAEITNLKEIIRKNWCGSYWRAVNHKDAEEVRAALKETDND